jgi:hypothetical protein
MLDFLRTVLPQAGPLCIAFRNKERKGFFHRVAKDHVAATKLSSWGASKNWDVYFCLSSLKDVQWEDAAGKMHKRKKENCARIQVLVLDVDIGASDKKYHTKEEALEALGKFTAALDFKPPMIVDSGYGLHVYWILSRPLDSMKWEILAGYFKKIAVALDARLAVDTSRIADCAGVLRVPGTKNYRNVDDPQRVKILQFTEESDTVTEISRKLFAKGRELGIGTVETRKISLSRGLTTLASDLGIDVPHDIEQVMRKCNWMREHYKHRATESEQEWYAGMGVLKHCYHPKLTTRQLVHKFSQGHPGYSEEETDAKFEQVKVAQSGPSKCVRLGSIVPARCIGCEYAQLVNTPAQLDNVDLPDKNPVKVETQFKAINGHVSKYVEEALPIPAPYFRGRSGGIYKNLNGNSIKNDQDDTASVQKIYEYDIVPLCRLENEDTGEEQIEVMLHLPKDGQRIIRIPIENTVEPKIFAKYLVARGVLLKQAEILPMINYMIDFIRVIQKTSESKGIYTRFGWRNPQSTDPMFVLGDGVIRKDGEFVPGNTSSSWLTELKGFASATGDIAKWREAFEINLQYSIPAYQYTMMLGFAAPLFALTPYSGMMFNLLGGGGIGKSTALKFMTSIWGKPTFTHILQKDNSIPVFNKIGYLNSMPVAYDEITMLPADSTAELAYSITEGRGKERADRGGNTRINTVKWSTILVSCSNLSLYEKIGLAKKGNVAPAYRIFETTVDEKVKKENRVVIEDALRILDSNYGVAGRLFMQYVVANSQEIATKLVTEEERISIDFKLANAERFWGGMFATVSVSMDICHELGIHSFEKTKILHWALNELAKTRLHLEESQGDVISIIGDYIDSNRHATLFVVDGRISAIGPSNVPLRELSIRFEKKNGRYLEGYISVMALKKYCQANKIEYGWLTKKLKDLDIVRETNKPKRIGAGTDFPNTPVSCVTLNLDSPYLNNLQELMP